MREFILLFILNTTISFSQSNLDLARKNLTTAVENKNICEQMIKQLSESKTSKERAYLGVYHTISAKHQVFPTSKLKEFNKGKKLLNNAVNEDKNNIENRYLRLLIQTQSPKFLGYNDEIKEDQEFLCFNYKKITPNDLKLKVYQLIKTTCKSTNN